MCQYVWVCVYTKGPCGRMVAQHLPIQDALVYARQEAAGDVGGQGAFKGIGAKNVSVFIATGVNKTSNVKEMFFFKTK